MKMMNTIKRSSALLLIFALLFLPFAGIKANAATGVDMSKECSLAFEEGQMDAEYAELKSIPVTVRLYQVADITVSGTYTPLPGYEALELPAAGGEVLQQKTGKNWNRRRQGLSQKIILHTRRSLHCTARSFHRQKSKGLLWGCIWWRPRLYSRRSMNMRLHRI